GALAAVNPCGLALLPAYLGLYLGDAGAGRRSLAAAAGRGTLIAASVAAGFVVLFGLAGGLLGLAGAAAGRAFPLTGLAAGVVLVLLAGRMLAGRPVQTATTGRLASALGPLALRGGLPGYFGYGLAYGLGSLGCALPVFLAVVATSLSAGTVAAALLRALAFGLGRKGVG